MQPPLFWYASPLGAIGFAFDAAALWEVRLFPRQTSPSPPLSEKARAFTQALDAYFSGQLSALHAFKTVPQRGTPFQREVWQALAQLAPHQCQTYSGVAALIGRPKAVRATGTAIGKNPLLLVLPCHRVLGADGSLCGFACGLEVKRWLLQHEAQHGGAPFFEKR